MDLDGDGHKDILSGSYSRTGEKTMAGLFQVLRGKADGTFHKAEAVKGTDGEPLIIPANDDDQITEKICTRPFAADWNGDGHLDLVVGNFNGSFYWFQGEGKGKFRPKPEAIKSGKEPLRIKGHHSDPFVVDWDGDGDLDLVSGSSDGGVQWAKNTAGKGKTPELQSFEPIIKPGKEAKYGEPLGEADLKGPTTSTRVWVADVNGDGKMDLLVGDSVTLIAPAKGVSADDFKKKFADWQKKVDEVSKTLSSEKASEEEREKANKEFQKVYQSRTEFMTEDRTGFVWLYVRK